MDATCSAFRSASSWASTNPAPRRAESRRRPKPVGENVVWSLEGVSRGQQFLHGTHWRRRCGSRNERSEIGKLWRRIGLRRRRRALPADETRRAGASICGVKCAGPPANHAFFFELLFYTSRMTIEPPSFFSVLGPGGRRGPLRQLTHVHRIEQMFGQSRRASLL